MGLRRKSPDASKTGGKSICTFMDWRDLRWALPSVLNMLEGGLFPPYDGVAHFHSASDGICTHQRSEREFAARSRAPLSFSHAGPIVLRPAAIC
ncbi:hypothetical protein G6F65_022389 [Rhizopus arrhizus]|nr:hypothetical protein G6F65_022389 [Rhizopus arrhizus]